jgi:hypothetical protein
LREERRVLRIRQAGDGSVVVWVEVAEVLLGLLKRNRVDSTGGNVSGEGIEVDVRGPDRDRMVSFGLRDEV